jgi:hypothetical protein
MFPRFECPLGLLEMQVVGGAEVHYFDFIINNGFIKTSIPFLYPQFQGNFFCFLFANARHAMNFDPQSAQRLNVGPAHESQTDDSDLGISHNFYFSAEPNKFSLNS